MRRIYDDYAYGPGPRSGCWWDETAASSSRPSISVSQKVDVAIIGAGFTGLSAALTLAQSGASVIVIDAERVGWGASGRNGGFCCLGGSKADDVELDRRFGKEARLEFKSAEKSAVEYVDAILKEHSIGVDRHSEGETELAHRPKDMIAMCESVKKIEENYGVTARILEPEDLASEGFGGGPFYGGLTVPIGFGLNPRKYVNGLANAAEKAGALIFEQSPVAAIERIGNGWRLVSGPHHIDAKKVVLATNGYSSEDVPEWLASRYMPTQSTVLVTRPMMQEELEAQGWTTDQMSYDTRSLVHYFRLMPDRRFLFGTRGGLLTGERSETRARAGNRADFERMFPTWAHVESQHTWSGFVSLAMRKVPFVGPVPDHPGMWASMCYHGNGVAMGSFSGHLLAEQMLGTAGHRTPQVMRTPLKKFPLGRARRVLMPPLYAQLMLKDY